MNFSLRLQDPTSGGSTLLELLLQSTQGMNRGVGMFSFASVNGVRLLLDNPAFKAFLATGQFQLIVGVDAVTVPEVLGLLGKYEAQYDGLRVTVFLHTRPGTLFHPKFCWFAGEEFGRVLVGSGNLTRGGLLKNWEAFGYALVPGEEMNQIKSEWLAWTQANHESLRSVDDEFALARAQLNKGREREYVEEEFEEAEIEEEEVEHALAESSATLVLMAEIPKGADRWNQANFSVEVFKNFFELQPGTFHSVVLYPVQADGTVGAPEFRQSVSVQSHNYRIELGQASGLSYPSGGRPIGLFLKTAPYEFRYRVLMPGQADHAEVAALLEVQSGRPDRVKRISLAYPEFRLLLPNVAL